MIIIWENVRNVLLLNILNFWLIVVFFFVTVPMLASVFLAARQAILYI
jgi:hypothetical protein